MSEGPRYFASDHGMQSRRIRYLFSVPAISAWEEPRRLTIHCTGEIANPGLWVDEKPLAPAQFNAELTSFRINLDTEDDKLKDGAQLFVLYSCWEPGVRIFKVEAQ